MAHVPTGGGVGIVPSGVGIAPSGRTDGRPKGRRTDGRADGRTVGRTLDLKFELKNWLATLGLCYLRVMFSEGPYRGKRTFGDASRAEWPKVNKPL